MPVRDIYLKIEQVPEYSPVQPTTQGNYRRDCMRNPGHEDGTIPISEANARKLTALVYREYLDPNYLVPKPDKLITTDINEPPYNHRVPGTVIYAKPGERLRIHVLNFDTMPHSFHMHGLAYGIDSDGSWPFGTQSTDGRRSDEICPGQKWTYTFDITSDMVGAWAFHDHWQHVADNVNQGLFGGLIVRPGAAEDLPDPLPLPSRLEELVRELRELPYRPVPWPPVLPTGPGTPVGPHPPIGPHGRAMHHSHTPHVVPGTIDAPQEIGHLLAMLDEQLHVVPRIHHVRRPKVLNVPLFFHFLAGPRSTPVFDSGKLVSGQQFTQPFKLEGTYNYWCSIHKAPMTGVIRVVPGGQSLASVTIVDNQFNPNDVTVGPNSTVVWTHAGQMDHTVTEMGTDSLPTYCLNGRAFAGNTPTILATAGQKIRWYVFNLDLGMNWHNFHPHAQRWKFANDVIDVRGLSPAESIEVETVAPPVLLLSPVIEKQQDPAHRPPGAVEYHLRGDFLFHCHVEMHMMQGMVGLVRSHQSVWLTPAQAQDIAKETGLPVDPGTDDCPAVPDRCDASGCGKWELVPDLPQITMMHAVLLPKTTKVLYWGYGPRLDQSRLWDYSTSTYSFPGNQPPPVNQPFGSQPTDVAPDANLWSCEHAFLNVPDGTVLVHGGAIFGVSVPANTERLSFLFNPAAPQPWQPTKTPPTALTAHARYYSTSLTLADGKVLTLFGANNITGVTSNSMEVYDPATGTWGSLISPVFPDYQYYPWTFVLPDGKLFIAGPAGITRRFVWGPTNVSAVESWNTKAGTRGNNHNGTAVLLPLRPPNYKVRVLIAGSNVPATANTAEMIDLSPPATATPAWDYISPMNRGRDEINSVLLPDGRVFVSGGMTSAAGDGGPGEIFDPETPSAGWIACGKLQYPRRYHSVALLLPDGSVLVGGDNTWESGANTPNERFYPDYCFKPRPIIAPTGTPATINYGATFAVQTPDAAIIKEVVLERPGAVTHAFNQSQRVIGCEIVGSGATSINVKAPPNGNVAPPGYYLLFIVSTARVPSLGVWIRLT